MQGSVYPDRAHTQYSLVSNRQSTGLKRAATLLIFAILAGCSTTYEGKYPTTEGWHPAKVVAVGTNDSLTQSVFKDCRKEIDGRPGRQADRYAMVSYSWLRSRRSSIVPLGVDSIVQTGDPVYVNLQDCSKPLVRQMNQ